MSVTKENAHLPHDGGSPAPPVYAIGGTIVGADQKQPRTKYRVLISMIVIGSLVIGLFITPIGQRIVDRTNEFLTEAASQQPLKQKHRE